MTTPDNNIAALGFDMQRCTEDAEHWNPKIRRVPDFALVGRAIAAAGGAVPPQRAARMTDEFTERRLVKARSDAVLAAANEAIDRRYAELRPHGLAIVELLHATAIAMERIKENKRSTYEFHLAQVVHVISTVLGVSDEQSRAIVERIYQQEL